MPQIGLGAALKAALLATVLAALIASVWHEIVSEPLIDRAIQLEEARHADAMEEPVVSRGVQKFVGLPLALMLYGLSYALALGAVLSVAQQHLPGDSLGRRAAFLALIVFWGVALLPSLKYPANPPGVGGPGTLHWRETMYYGLSALAVAAAIPALVFWNRVRGRAPVRILRQRGGWVAVGAYLLLCLALYLAFPANPDPVPIPAELVAGFRLRSVLGLAMFWGGFALVFGLLVERFGAGRHAPTRELRVSRFGS